MKFGQLIRGGADVDGSQTSQKGSEDVAKLKPGNKSKLKANTLKSSLEAYKGSRNITCTSSI